MIKHLNMQNFEAEIAENSLILIDFYADWCGPCKMLAPILEEIAAEKPQITVGKMNVDDCVAFATQLGITSIPTLILFQNGAFFAVSAAGLDVFAKEFHVVSPLTACRASQPRLPR